MEAYKNIMDVQREAIFWKTLRQCLTSGFIDFIVYSQIAKVLIKSPMYVCYLYKFVCKLSMLMYCEF